MPIITEELITGETAKLAKEKGFDIHCKEKFYHLAGEFQMQYGSGKYWEDEQGEEWQEEVLYSRTKGIGKRTILNEYNRPTQSLLQRWLREIHGIHVQPQKTFHNKTYLVGKIPKEFRILGKGLDAEYGKPSSYITAENKKFNTYEEALEFGLLRALNQI